MNVGSVTTSEPCELGDDDFFGRRFVTSSITFKLDSFVSVNIDRFPVLKDRESCAPSISASYPWMVNIDHVHSIANWSLAAMTNNAREDLVGMSDVHNTIEMLYQWEHNDQGRMASAYAVYFVECNFSKNNLSAVNNLLLNASTDRLTEWSMVAILRASFSARASLPAWARFMESVRDRLKDNERLERLLVGLSR